MHGGKVWVGERQLSQISKLLPRKISRTRKPSFATIKWEFLCIVFHRTWKPDLFLKNAKIQTKAMVTFVMVVVMVMVVLMVMMVKMVVVEVLMVMVVVVVGVVEVVMVVW